MSSLALTPVFSKSINFEEINQRLHTVVILYWSLFNRAVLDSQAEHCRQLLDNNKSATARQVLEEHIGFRGQDKSLIPVPLSYLLWLRLFQHTSKTYCAIAYKESFTDPNEYSRTFEITQKMVSVLTNLKIDKRVNDHHALGKVLVKLFQEIVSPKNQEEVKLKIDDNKRINSVISFSKFNIEAWKKQLSQFGVSMADKELKDICLKENKKSPSGFILQYVFKPTAVETKGEVHQPLSQETGFIVLSISELDSILKTQKEQRQLDISDQQLLKINEWFAKLSMHKVENEGFFEELSGLPSTEIVHSQHNLQLSRKESASGEELYTLSFSTWASDHSQITKKLPISSKKILECLSFRGFFY